MSVEPEELGQSGEELAALLKAVRKRSGLSGARAAARCNMSQSKVSRIENGKVRPSLVDVEQILRACEADPALVSRVMNLARLAHTQWQGARGMRRKGLERKQLELAGLEASSAELRFFLLSMITGLLSTPEYIRASLAHIPGDHARTIARKLERQQVLYDRSKRFTFILTEQAVRWPLVGPDALAVQVDHLASLTHLPNVRLGVVPLTVPTGPAPLNTFTVYDDRIATVELSTGVMVFRDPRDVASHREEFSHLEDRALFGDDARDFLGACAAALR
ncbi:helix-turn-helix domain-containing protein [Streptomyces sp. NBC_01264]|uniref:helix-turn-helix domain-containing protein n=1 Tax=Streptomyces sp. NBC_01264 TaxID=2903804 RepID=UPI0022514AFD|nr:helix-turn-helix transcriptional regulator [Streptomyces sp. NBC_01264]MCX4779099.1 helix-turn-helix domain-containing protein [Streptomyces sp. NBC_01264]